MNKILFIIILLLSTPVLAADYVCHVGGVINRVVFSSGTLHTDPECLSITRAKALQITKFYKVDGSIVGSNDDKVVEMMQSEKDALLASELATIITSNRNDAKDRFDDRHWKAFVKILLDEINILRSQHNLSNRTQNQLENAIEAHIDAGNVD